MNISSSISKTRKIFSKNSNIDKNPFNAIISNVSHRLRPLKIDKTKYETKRINIVIASLDPQIFFGGIISIFHFAESIRKRGRKVRLVVLDDKELNFDLCKNEIKQIQGLDNFAKDVELFNAYDRNIPLKVNENDIFVATYWSTAHVTNSALQFIKPNKFIYFIQDFEPFFHEHGTLYALTYETYSFPHYAIFSTDFLRDYFRKNRIGVFKSDLEEGNFNSVSFQNAIPKFDLHNRQSKNKEKNRFLFYSRPYRKRNMFELGILALSNAIKNGCFNLEKWDFDGIGLMTDSKNLKLYKNVSLELKTRTDLNEYTKLLPQYDIGLSLMLSPHPNLVTLDMASAGMIVITNSYANKNQESLGKISSNIIVAEPTINSIESAIFEAVKRTNNRKSDDENPTINWPSRWDETFNDDIMRKIEKFFSNC